MANMIDKIEGYRKQIKQLKRLKQYDILHKLLDDVLPIAQHTLGTLEKSCFRDGKLAKAYRRFIRECEDAA